MAEYYGKLRDNNENKMSKKIKKIFKISIFTIGVILVISAFVGIFGDTQRRDQTRDIIRENTQLKQQISQMQQRITELESINREMSAAVEKYKIEAGKTIEKPEGDLADVTDDHNSNTEG